MFFKIKMFLQFENQNLSLLSLKYYYLNLFHYFINIYFFKNPSI
jgi:hypothetical protein